MVKSGRTEACNKAALCCWVIWKSRNEMSFQNVIPTQQSLRIKLNLEINQYRMGSGRDTEVVRSDGSHDRSDVHQQRSDQMPRNPTWRFLCDGSFKEDIRKAGIGILKLSPDDRVVDGVACHVLCRSPVVAEAYAVLTACKLAARERIQAEVWSDCRVLVQACLDEEDEGPWECSSIIAKVKEVIRECPSITIVNCRRERVEMEDKIARKARDQALEQQWLQGVLGCYVL